jgi:membrane protein YqaA with SNARE-associated domain
VSPELWLIFAVSCVVCAFAGYWLGYGFTLRKMMRVHRDFEMQLVRIVRAECRGHVHLANDRALREDESMLRRRAE